MLTLWNKRKFKELTLLTDEMRERGEYLLRNPKLGKRAIKRTKRGKEFSNCFGTSVWIMGQWAQEEACRISRNIPQIYEHCENSVIAYKNRPSFFETNVLETFLQENFTREKSGRPGDLIIVEDDLFYRKHGWSVVHAGVWTGVDNYALTQHNIGGVFELEKFFNGNPFQKNYYFARLIDPTS